MQVPRCFCPWGSLSRISGSRGLVVGSLPTFWHKLRCHKYPLYHTPYYYYQLQIPSSPLFSCLPAPSLWYLAPAGICRKYHGSSIVLAVRVYRLGYPPSAKLEKAQKTSPSASDCIWFWYICCSTKSSHREPNF